MNVYGGIELLSIGVIFQLVDQVSPNEIYNKTSPELNEENLEIIKRETNFGMISLVISSIAIIFGISLFLIGISTCCYGFGPTISRKEKRHLRD